MELNILKHSNDISSVMMEVNTYPLVKYYLEQLEVGKIFHSLIGRATQSMEAPAQVLCVLIANIIISRQPLYKINKWISQYIDGKAQPMSEKSMLYTDDRCASALDKLYKADRNTILTMISANAVKIHNLELNQIHNDSTSISFTGAYDDVCDPNGIQIVHGFSKDHRPDYKQIVFGLDITADGNVPIGFNIFDGNRTDDTTHIDNWDKLRKFIDSEDFVYIADSKLCAIANLEHIAAHGGTFITVLPKNRTEVKTFYKKIESDWQIPWCDEYKIPSSRKKNEYTRYKVYEELQSGENRIIWVYSSAKEYLDQKIRTTRLKTTIEQIQELVPKLNKRKLKTIAQIEDSINTINKHNLLIVTITEHKEVIQKQITRGNPTPQTQYKEIETSKFVIDWHIDQDNIDKLALRDGIFPLITNTDDAPLLVLQRYKNQPFLEKRFQTAKTVLEVAPVFLKKPERIEAMMFLYFVALMIVSLMERNIRQELKKNPTELRILPENRNTTKPTWNNIKEFFTVVHLIVLLYQQQVIKVQLHGLSTIHKTVLKLLLVSINSYATLETITETQKSWWQFKLAG